MHGSRCKPVLRKSVINEIAPVRPEFTTSTYSCSHPFCSCPSSCFILDCFLFRPAAKLLSWDILGIFFTFVESLFSWIPCLPFSLFLLFGFFTITVKECMRYFGGFRFYPHAWLLGCFHSWYRHSFFHQNFVNCIYCSFQITDFWLCCSYLFRFVLFFINFSFIFISFFQHCISLTIHPRHIWHVCQWTILLTF